MFEILVVLAAGFLCGGLNAVAGGGTFVTLPVLIWVGIPPIIANATATATAVPGYCASAWAYRDDIRAEGSLRLGTIVSISAVGGILGAVLLVLTSAEAFLRLVPWLLLLATFLFAAAPRVLDWLTELNFGPASAPVSLILILAVTTYGGYFNGGLGIIMLAALSLQGYRNLHGMNGLKNVLSSMLSILSVVTFVTADLIAWNVATPMALGNICGAYLASKMVRQIRRIEFLRFGIILIGMAMTVIFFVV